MGWRVRSCTVSVCITCTASCEICNCVVRRISECLCALSKINFWCTATICEHIVQSRRKFSVVGGRSCKSETKGNYDIIPVCAVVLWQITDIPKLIESSQSYTRRWTLRTLINFRQWKFKLSWNCECVYLKLLLICLSSASKICCCWNEKCGSS